MRYTCTVRNANPAAIHCFHSLRPKLLAEKNNCQNLSRTHSKCSQLYRHGVHCLAYKW